MRQHQSKQEKIKTVKHKTGIPSDTSSSGYQYSKSSLTHIGLPFTPTPDTLTTTKDPFIKTPSNTL